MKELVGKNVVISVKVDGKDKPFVYNGKLLGMTRTDVTLDDVQLGRIVFPKGQVTSIREMNRIDMIELARKYERWAIKLKMQQADDKVKKKFEELTAAFRKTAGE